MKDSLRNTVRSAFFEAVFVVFGVVLALAANEWRENVKAREVAAGALADIVAELQANRDLVADSRSYHNERVGIIHGKLGAGEPVTGADFPRGFIRPAWVTETAWDVAKSTGIIADMDYATVLDISRAYDDLDHYTRQSDLVGGLIYDAIFAGGTEGIAGRPRNLMTIIYTFIYRETQLLAKLDEVLGRHGGAGADASADASADSTAAPGG